LNRRKLFVSGILLIVGLSTWFILKQGNLNPIEPRYLKNQSKHNAVEVASYKTQKVAVEKGIIETNLKQNQPVNILECNPKTKEIDLTQYSDQSMAQINNKLKHSGSSFDQLAFNLMQDFKISKMNSQKQAQNNFDWLLEYSQNDESNNLALFSLLQACSNNFKLQGCEEVETKAKFTLADNAAIWQVIASKYIKQGNDLEAIKAIKNASNSTFYANYNFEFEDLYRESLLANGFANDYNQAIILAKGYTLARPNTSYTQIIKFCKNNASSIEASCLKMGSVMKNASSDILTGAVGANLLKGIHKVNNNKEEIEKQEAYIKDLFSREHFDKVTNLMTYDESLIINYIENWRQYGELKAVKLAVADAIKKSKDINYNPCI
jgi:hypothetical protein